MKIVLAGQNYWVNGGSDKVMIEHEKILQARGHDVIPFASASEQSLPTKWAKYFPKDVSFSQPKASDLLNYIYSMESKRKISALLDASKPDIVHCNIYYGKLSSSIIGEIKSRGIPLFQTLHEYKSVCPTYAMQNNGVYCNACSGFKFYNSVLKQCNSNSFSRSLLSMVESYVSLLNGSINKFDKFIAVSDFLRNEVVSMGMPKDKVVTIHNPIDTISKTMSFKNDGYFLYYGRIELNKGLLELLSVFENLPSKKLVILGGGGKLDYIQSIVAKKNLSNIKILGHKTGVELEQWIKNSYSVLVPSTCTETFGLSAAEAMAYGKPVIASDIGGLPEVIGREGAGILCPPGDIDALSNAVNYLSSNTSIADDMGKNARDRVEKLFSHEAYYKKILALYEEYM